MEKPTHYQQQTMEVFMGTLDVTQPGLRGVLLKQDTIYLEAVMHMQKQKLYCLHLGGH